MYAIFCYSDYTVGSIGELLMIFVILSLLYSAFESMLNSAIVSYRIVFVTQYSLSFIS